MEEDDDEPQEEEGPRTDDAQADQPMADQRMTSGVLDFVACLEDELALVINKKPYDPQEEMQPNFFLISL